MAKGPRGEKRPADVIGGAVKVMRIATGEESEDVSASPQRASRAKAGAAGRAAKLTGTQRSEIARLAAEARWKKSGA